MPSLRFKSMVGLMVAGSMIISSTGAVAASPSAISAQQIDPWATLSVMSAGAPAAALCGAAATAGQAPAAGCVLPAVDQVAVAAGPPPPTPVPAVEPVGGGLGISPLWLALGALALGAAVYFLLLKDDDDGESPD
jgi:hypothetical protein